MFNKISHSSIQRESSITAELFTEKYKETATPVVFSSLMDAWPAKKKWSVDYLSKVIGDQLVPVYSSNPAKGTEHQHAPSAMLKVADYLSMLKDGENDLRIFFYNLLEKAPKLIKDFSYPDLGLKFFKRLPVLFIGGRGAKVQMHYDIDLADLVLCHFGGTKHVLLIPPEQSKYMYQVPFSFSALFDVDFSNPDFDKYPALRKLRGMTAVLNHGDALYIPSGYWHYIIYEDVGFSLTLRAMPTKIKQRVTLLKNVFLIRSIEGLMRKLVGQKWNDRNERMAITRTHQTLKDEAK